MSSERLTGEWLINYVGPHLFRCAWCGTTYEHDQSYRHWNQCQKRKKDAA